MKMRYDLMFKNGRKEKVIQSANEAEHMQIIQLINDAFSNNLEAIITFGDGESRGRYVRVSDLSQVETEILE